MTTRKRWSEVYTESNPLSLPQAIKRELKGCCKEASKERIQFLWLVFGQGDAAPGQMDVEHWLNVIDEAASTGACTCVISVEGPLQSWPDIWTLCEWAIETHKMLVGIHLAEPKLTESDIARLTKFDTNHICIFLHSSQRSHIEHALGDSVRVIDADGLEDGVVQHHCDLPSKMTCVSGSGALYTCGLVLGRDGFYLGDVNDVRIDRVLDDDGVPHCVPANTSTDPHRCDGCPPLLEERMRKAFGTK